MPATAVGFSPADALAALADHVGWTGTFLVDTDRSVYRRLGLKRAPLWRVYSVGTIGRYASAVLRGTRLRGAVEDTRQLGGDAVIRDGVAVRVWAPRSPDDRTDPELLVAAAGSL